MLGDRDKPRLAGLLFVAVALGSGLIAFWLWRWGPAPYAAYALLLWWAVLAATTLLRFAYGTLANAKTATRREDLRGIAWMLVCFMFVRNLSRVRRFRMASSIRSSRPAG